MTRPSLTVEVVARWIAKKEDAKRFPGLIRESRLAAFRHAPAARASARASLCTKLSLLLSHALDSPTSLAACRRDQPRSRSREITRDHAGL